MPTPLSPDPKVERVLAKLSPLNKDQYFTAFLPDGSAFYGGPTGKGLPPVVMTFLASGTIKKVLFASFGSEPESWFMVFEDTKGYLVYGMGEDVPRELRSFVDEHKEGDPFLRAQLGADESFIAWTKYRWVSKGLPASLERILDDNSYCIQNGSSKLFMAPPTTIAFHANGSCFFSGRSLVQFGGLNQRMPYHQWTCASKTFDAAMKQSCPSGEITATDLNDLAVSPDNYIKLMKMRNDTPEYVAINPYDKTGNSFVIIKKAKGLLKPDYICHFPNGEVFTKLAPLEVATEAQPTKKARSKEAGRPHPGDTWELELELNEIITVLFYQGNNWYFVQNDKGEKGFAHGSALDFKVNRVPKRQPDLIKQHQAAEAYAAFTNDIRELLVKANIEEFPVLSKYMAECRQNQCAVWQSGGAQICIHDLTRLLQGSGKFSVELVKEERNKWHPDMFARFCHPEAREDLKKPAEDLFVLMGVLKDQLEDHLK